MHEALGVSRLSEVRAVDGNVCQTSVPYLATFGFLTEVYTEPKVGSVALDFQYPNLRVQLLQRTECRFRNSGATKPTFGSVT